MDFDKLFSLKGKTVFITGASRGLGFAVACGLVRAGAALAFCARTEESVEKGLAAYKENNITAYGYACDITDEAKIKETVALVEKEAGPVNILINNAGIINRTPLTEMDAAEFRKVIDVDLTGAFIVSKAVLPSMIKNGGGKIINICGILSEVGRETAAAYSSAKGGLKLLTKNIASEYGGYNIQCNAIGPGYIETSLNAQLREKQSDGSKNPFDRFIRTMTPAGRWGKPEDLVGAAIFLASGASNYVNGQVLYVDGGFLAYLGRQTDA